MTIGIRVRPGIFARNPLRRMIRFAEAFRRVSDCLDRCRDNWPGRHFLAIICRSRTISQRDFYAELCRMERWSVRMLRSRIQSMLYERTALSTKPEQLVEQELKGLREEDRAHSRSRLPRSLRARFPRPRETRTAKRIWNTRCCGRSNRSCSNSAAGFAFVERQKRITLDGDDYYIDLLFYHRRLQAAGGHRTQDRRLQARRCRAG